MSALTSLAFVFPGQGSQKIGMLSELATQFPVIQHTFQEASDAIHLDLWQIAQSGEGLDLTQNTQPVLLTASIAIWRVWQTLTAIQPRYLAGHSLGEYSALVAGEALSLTEAVQLVHLRGKLMQNAVAPQVGSMAAILGLTDEKVQELCQQIQAQNPQQTLEIANYNTEGQVVIAGHRQLVDLAIQSVKNNGAKAIALSVSVPSHCSLMKTASDEFAQALNQANIQLPHIPVIHNVNVQVATDVNQLRQSLIEQLYQSVQWTKTMQKLQHDGIQYIIECGSGNVLTNLAKRLPHISKALASDTPSRIQEAISTLSTLEV